MKTIEIKNGNRTTYKIVPDDYVEEKKDTFRGDLTTGGRKCIDTGLSEEQYKAIFGKKDDKV